MICYGSSRLCWSTAIYVSLTLTAACTVFGSSVLPKSLGGLSEGEEALTNLNYSKPIGFSLSDPAPSAWISQPGGGPPTWDDLIRHMECRADMSFKLAKMNIHCGPLQSHPPCNFHVAIVQMMMGEKAAKPGQQLMFKHGNRLLHKYCQFWGTCEVLTFLNPPIHERDPDTKERAISWLKVWLMRDLIRNHTAHPPPRPFTHYMWMDGDASIVDHSIDLRMVLAMAHNKTAIFSDDAFPMPATMTGGGFNGHYVNGGVWAFRNNPLALDILHEWWNSTNHNSLLNMTKNDIFWEQGAFNLHVHKQYPDAVHVLPFCYFYGYPWNLVDKPFTAHLAGSNDVYQTQQAARYLRFWDDMTHVKHTHPQGRHIATPRHYEQSKAHEGFRP